ncbi:MAG: hypothetical protein V3T86_06345 [Planctomycetota bacterium]
MSWISNSSSAARFLAVAMLLSGALLACSGPKNDDDAGGGTPAGGGGETPSGGGGETPSGDGGETPSGDGGETPSGDEGPPANQKVLIEIHRMVGTPELSQTGLDRIKGIFAEANLDLRYQDHGADIPSSPTVRLGDLHALMTTFRQNQPGSGEWKLDLLIVTARDGGSNTLGIMFDHGGNDLNSLPREGCAVFHTAHANMANEADEMILTTVHELAHCFNIHHTDWDPDPNFTSTASFNRHATIESYSMADTVRWSLSSKSIEHIKHHDGDNGKFVRPGPGGIEFGFITQDHDSAHQSDPPENYVIVTREGARTLERGRPVDPSAIIRTSNPGAPREVSGLKLVLEAPSTSFRLGEPVTLTVRLKNGGDTVNIYQALAPEQGFLRIGVRAATTDRARPYRPIAWSCSRVAPTPLKNGAEISAKVRLFFGAKGWTFTKPGKYLVTADFPAGNDRVTSEPLTIEIKAALDVAASTSSRALQQRCLDKDVGLYLYFNGASHLAKAESALEDAYADAKAFSANQKAAYGLAIGSSLVRPTIASSKTDRVRPPDLDKAATYLKSALTANVDADIAVAVKQQLADAYKLAKRSKDAADITKEIESYEAEKKR